MDKELEFSLIHQSAKGNTQAFRDLVEANQAFALSLAARFVYDVADAEDIVQDAFVRVWKNLHRYDFTYRFKTWLGKIVTNLCVDAGRSARKKHVHQSVDDPIRLPPIANENATDDVELHELKEIISRLAQELAPKQRAVFILRDLEQLEPEEVCKALDINNGTMKSNLYHARLHIKTGIEKYYGTMNPKIISR